LAAGRHKSSEKCHEANQNPAAMHGQTDRKQETSPFRRTDQMTKTPRWMKSAIVASTETTPALPWTRANRCKPESMKAPAPKTHAIAAR
jgi:hypothetical protein